MLFRSTLTKVIELLGAYVCNITNVANYTIPVCMQSYSITDFVGMQNAMMDLLCQQHDINVTGLTWGCTPSGTTTLLQDTIQEISALPASEKIFRIDELDQWLESQKLV